MAKRNNPGPTPAKPVIAPSDSLSVVKHYIQTTVMPILNRFNSWSEQVGRHNALVATQIARLESNQRIMADALKVKIDTGED